MIPTRMCSYYSTNDKIKQNCDRDCSCIILPLSPDNTHLNEGHILWLGSSWHCSCLSLPVLDQLSRLYPEGSIDKPPTIVHSLERVKDLGEEEGIDTSTTTKLDSIGRPTALLFHCLVNELH